MKILKSVWSHAVMLLFGLVVGWFSMWNMALNAINNYNRQQKKCNRRPKYKSFYRD